jgi:hypothetical protein
MNRYSGLLFLLLPLACESAIAISGNQVVGKEPTPNTSTSTDGIVINSAQRFRGGSVNQKGDYVIRLQRTQGRAGPFYTVTILGDRSATFVSPALWSTPDNCCDLIRKKTLSVANYNLLVRQIEGMKFFRLDPIYSAPVFDQPGIAITVIAPNGDIHRVLRYAVGCETEFHSYHHDQSQATSQMQTGASRKRVVTDADYLNGVVPAPDSLCKLESMIDSLTDADEWAKEQQIPPKH